MLIFLLINNNINILYYLVPVSRSLAGHFPSENCTLRPKRCSVPVVASSSIDYCPALSVRTNWCYYVCIVRVIILANDNGTVLF